MFTEVPGNVVILLSGGVFYQKPIYRCSLNDRVYAKWGGGFIRLGADNATSAPKVGIASHCYKEAPNVVVRDKFKGPEFV